jgi:RNA polymerase sigma factor (TIGR02999 family)
VARELLKLDKTASGRSRDLETSPGEITQLLFKWQQGSSEALEALMPVVYPHLRRIASSYIRGSDNPGVLQATALVHELYLRLVSQKKADWADQAHFFAFSARVMRMILIDHARSNLAKKRGGHAQRVPLHEQLPWVEIGGESMLDLNAALDELKNLDPQKVQLIEVRYFLGCTAEETADMMRVSKATVNRDLKFARSWLLNRIEKGNSESAHACVSRFSGDFPNVG